MKERIQKLIASAGVASRRAAEEMIKAGRVKVNGRPAALGQTAEETDYITIDGRPLPQNTDLVYIMLNKPRGYISTMKDDRGRRTVADLVKEAPGRLYPVGRLDYDSEGLLLMTNDGELANKLMHPRYGMLKTYLVSVEGEDLVACTEALRQELSIDGVKVRAKHVEIFSREPDRLLITIGEGRNRQVRRMCEQAQLKVKRLIRIAEGELELGKLRSGKWRLLDRKEIDYLRQWKNK